MSKLILFDFTCGNCGHQFEELVKPAKKSIKCPECSSGATRDVSLGHINYRKMGVDPDFPTAGEKWAKMQERRKIIEKGRGL